MAGMLPWGEMQTGSEDGSYGTQRGVLSQRKKKVGLGGGVVFSTFFHSLGAVSESSWPSWAVRPNEPHVFRGRKAILNHASALVSACP